MKNTDKLQARHELWQYRVQIAKIQGDKQNTIKAAKRVNYFAEKIRRS